MRLLCTALLTMLTLGAENRILVYTHNGKGYIHENRPASVAAIRELGRENGFEVDASDDPSVFTSENLNKYKALVFSNTKNETFDPDAKRQASRRFIKPGGGLVGLHIAPGGEQNGPFYRAVMGGNFLRPPPLQKFTVVVK